MSNGRSHFFIYPLCALSLTLENNFSLQVLSFRSICNLKMAVPHCLCHSACILYMWFSQLLRMRYSQKLIVACSPKL